jgi:class 3 adenylate cyclase
MAFVNRISAIVHYSVVRYSGSPNKNIGESFLLVWKIAEEEKAIEYENNLNKCKKDLRHLSEYQKTVFNKASDFAVLSFLKIIAKIHSLEDLGEFSNDTRIRYALPEFKLEMGFGLHLGWAIEGLIGSDYKVDASYLSPHVNIAARLESATKQFGVSILISETVKKVLSKSFQVIC